MNQVRGRSRQRTQHTGDNLPIVNLNTISQNTRKEQRRSRSVSMQRNSSDYTLPSSQNRVRGNQSFNLSKPPPPPKDICKNLKMGLLCLDDKCEKDHNLDNLTNREILLLIAKKTLPKVEITNIFSKNCGSIALSKGLSKNKQDANKETLTLENLGQILNYLHRSDISKLDEESLRAALSLTCAGIRKTNRSMINTMTEAHLSNENLPQDQMHGIKQTYTGIHLDKGGQFESALWRGWDQKSIALFVQAALNILNQIPCESSGNVQAAYDHFILPSRDNN
nr:minor nucleoprotein VP30 [Dehong virus]